MDCHVFVVMLDDEKLVLLFSETELSLVTEFYSYSEPERTIPLPFLGDPTSAGSYCLQKASWRKRSCCVAVFVIFFSLRKLLILYALRAIRTCRLTYRKLRFQIQSRADTLG